MREDNSENVALAQAYCVTGTDVFMKLAGVKTGNVSVVQTNTAAAQKAFETAGGVPADAVIVK